MNTASLIVHFDIVPNTGVVRYIADGTFSMLHSEGATAFYVSYS